MATPLELIGDKVPLKDDKSRVSIEGGLAGASLAVILSVLMPELVEAAEWAAKLLDGPRPVEGNPLEDGGRLSSFKDQISIAPLNPAPITGVDQVDLEEAGRRANPPTIRPATQAIWDDQSPFVGDSIQASQLTLPSASSSPVGSGIGREYGDYSNNPEYQPASFRLVEDDRYIKVDVNSPVRAISSSVDGLGNAIAKADLAGLDGTAINISPLNYLGRAISYNEGRILKDTSNLVVRASSMLGQGNLLGSGLDIGETPTVGLATTGVVGSVARSVHADATASLEGQNSGTRNSQISSFRDAAEFISVKARDFIDLLTQAGKLAVGQIVNTTTGLSNTILRTGDRSDSILVSANTQSDVLARQGTDGLSLDIGVNTIGLDGSTIRSNKGDDEIQVMAKMENMNDSNLPGFSITIEQGLEPTKGDIRINLNSTGLRKSTIDSGPGNDRIFVDAGIDEYLAAQISSMAVDANHDLNIDASKSITSLNESIINTGSGDDIVLLRGDVVDSTVDLGPGRNQLVIQGDVNAGSSIKLNDGDTYINIPLYGRTQVLTNGDDNWLAKDSSDVSLVLGGDGNDTLSSRGEFKDRVEVIGRDVGKLYNTAFVSVENVQLGGGNDVVLFKDYGALSGQLDSGNGLDTVSYEDSKNALLYSGQGENLLDPGTTSTGGLGGFETVIGSNNGDVFVLSNDLAGAADPLRTIRLGTGKDLIAFNDVGALTAAWDGIGGAPVIDNLNLATGDQIAYRYGGANDAWIIQKDIPSLPNDLFSSGIGEAGFGLAIGVSNDNLSSVSLYLTGQQSGNVELAKLRNVTLPSSSNFASS
ncbi:hypothetical protein KBY85_08020 [Cyanobium sp. BA5m-10]|uniref:hypothetical protein n=1 Tax=Cyanobium sp. BA5m-10 TaxID=2823705 RepID=UPI0020CCB15E|nr:hypothetical protein [Cyanobium sp. BA5m-10]MCP9904082.1 hypothetical protein [Cyanobium sp. BA5m-10]